MQVPNVRVFDDFGGAAMGVWGRRLVYCTVYLTIMGEPIIFHLTSMEALQQIFYRSSLSQGVAAAIVAGLMVPLAQVRPEHCNCLALHCGASSHRGHKRSCACRVEAEGTKEALPLETVIDVAKEQYCRNCAKIVAKSSNELA